MKSDKEKLDIILKYCQPYMEYMWAATIVSEILECDFRDAEEKLQDYFKCEETT